MSKTERFEVVSLPESNGTGSYYATIDYEQRVFRTGMHSECGGFVKGQIRRSGKGWREQLRVDAMDYLRMIDE